MGDFLNNVNSRPVDQLKSNMFCLGLTLMSAANLSSMNSCFNFQNKKILDKEIKYQLSEV